MKPTVALPTLIALTLGSANSFANAFTPGSAMGEITPLTAATRTIPLDANTKYVNVAANETVRFETKGNAFAIYFVDGLAMFDLNQLVPPGLLDHKVTAYVAPDPLRVP